MNRFLGFSSSNLAYKFSFVILLIIVALGSFIFLAINTIVTKSLYEQHKLWGLSIASTLASNAVDLLLLEKFSQLQFMLENTQNSDQEIVYIFTIGTKGQVHGHTFHGGFPNDLKRLVQRQDKQTSGSQLIETEKGILLEVSAPILHGSLGSVHVGLSRKSIEQKLKDIQLRVFLICFLACIASIILAFLFSRRITKPLTALALGAESIGQGDLAHRVEIDSRDELGVVASAFNRMAASLEGDIAKRKEVEKALRESEELYRSLVENINMGITLIDQDHTIIMANATQGRMFNKAPSEFSGHKCFQEFEKRNDVCGHCPGVTAMEGGSSNETIAQGQRDDGSTFTVRIKAFPVQDEDGQGKGFIEVVEDITEQLKIQQDLAIEKERLAVTLRSIGDGVITTDISGNIVLLNKVAENLTGWSNEDAVGRSLQEVCCIINEQTREICENPATKAISNGQIVELANRTVLVAKDGREMIIADSGAPILDAGSNIIGGVLVFRDVTEQVKAEKELLKVKKLESVGVLAGGIAHDFNNILAAILGNINLAQFDPDLSESTKSLLMGAEKASLRAKDLTLQLLTFAKGGEPIKETSSLESVIKDSASFVLHGDNVACNYDIPEDLWLVDIDKGQISQVIQNIVLNASHAMPERGVIKITCENTSSVIREALPWATTGNYVKICIQDNGVGIPANVMEKIFDPYYTTKHEGSGLGLAISQSIIHKHDGHISVKSSPGVGTTFTIYLPVSEKTEIKQQEQELEEEDLSSSKAKILIMDDEEIVRDVAQQMLVLSGHEVEVARDGGQAVKLYQEAINSNSKFDLVIMDLTVPGGMGGKEAVRKIINIDPDAKVIASSGYSTDPIMANFEEYGFCSAIVKPYQFHELVRVIGLVIDQDALPEFS